MYRRPTNTAAFGTVRQTSKCYRVSKARASRRTELRRASIQILKATLSLHPTPSYRASSIILWSHTSVERRLLSQSATARLHGEIQILMTMTIPTLFTAIGTKISLRLSVLMRILSTDKKMKPLPSLCNLIRARTRSASRSLNCTRVKIAQAVQYHSVAM